MIQNRAPVPLADNQVTPVLVDAAGRVVSMGNRIGVRGPVASGQQGAVGTGTGLTQEQLQFVRFRIDGARPAE